MAKEILINSTRVNPKELQFLPIRPMRGRYMVGNEIRDMDGYGFEMVTESARIYSLVYASPQVAKAQYERIKLEVMNAHAGQTLYV